MKNTSRLTLTMSVVFLCSTPAYSWKKILCNGSPQKIYVLNRTLCPSTISFPVSGPFRVALNDVITRWNFVQKMQFSLGTDGTNCTFSGSSTDGASSTWFTQSMPPGTESSTATTVIQAGTFDCNLLLASDVIFNANKSWISSENMAHVPFSGSTTLPFYSVSMHELGHALGLNHEDRDYNLMGIDQSFVTFVNTTSDYRPGEDATHGAINNYGEPYHGRPDIGVTTFRFKGAIVGDGSPADGGYAVNEQGGFLVNSTLANVTPFLNTIVPQPTERYTLKKGVAYRMLLTFENIGDVDPFNVSIAAKLSSSPTLSPFTSLGNYSLSTSIDSGFARDGWAYQTYLTITIPSGAALGNNYIGVTTSCTIPAGGVCNDMNTWNNSTYYAINITN